MKKKKLIIPIELPEGKVFYIEEGSTATHNPYNGEILKSTDPSERLISLEELKNYLGPFAHERNYEVEEDLNGNFEVSFGSIPDLIVNGVDLGISNVLEHSERACLLEAYLINIAHQIRVSKLGMLDNKINKSPININNLPEEMPKYYWINGGKSLTDSYKILDGLGNPEILRTTELTWSDSIYYCCGGYIEVLETNINPILSELIKNSLPEIVIE